MAAPEVRPDIIDAPLLRVPFESLKRAAKERKAIVDEAAEAVTAAVTGAAAAGGGAEAGAGTSTAVIQLDALLERLQGLKRKLADVSAQEEGDADRVRVRLAHVLSLGQPPRAGVVAWHNRGRLTRLIVDHLLRTGHTAVAARLAQEAGIEPLCELHIFAGVAGIVDALRRHDCGPALAWCGEHRGRLRKVKSCLEFRLRLQEFLELVRQEQRLAAVAYARSHLAPWASAGHMPQLQRALATLAFGTRTLAERPKLAPYAALFSDAAWGSLLEAFHRELYRLHCLLPESALSVHLQAGLVALKNTPSTASASRQDPLSHPDFAALASHLPAAKHVHSKLICAITREIMSDANPPLVLPNGYVYSQGGCEALAAAHGGGRVVCPRTGAEYGLEEARRAYIV